MQAEAKCIKLHQAQLTAAVLIQMVWHLLVGIMILHQPFHQYQCLAVAVVLILVLSMFTQAHKE